MFSRNGSTRISVLMAGALAMGAMFGGSVVSIASPQATVIYTRTASCGGLNFYTASSDQPYGEIDTMRTANGQVRCNPALPNGAVVTKVSFTVYDNTDNGEAGGCALIKAYLVPSAIEGAEFPYTNMTNYMQTGQAATPGLIRLTDTSITSATIDNVKNAYYVQCDLNTPVGLGLYGASVTYKISSTKG